MKKILIATTNPGKVHSAKKILAQLGWEGLSFEDLNLNLLEPDETKATAEEIAVEKAIGYAKQVHDLPLLARDDTIKLIGVDEEDDPKNRNKEFIAQRMGEYTVENGEKVFSDIAKKYGGEVPFVFDYGYAVAWWDDGGLKTMSGLAQKEAKLVAKPSPQKVPGFCFASVCQVEVNGEWKYDSELIEDESFSVYWAGQKRVISELLNKMEGNDE
jgi:Xanthosine triphosphate pyrophosphatase